MNKKWSFFPDPAESGSLEEGSAYDIFVPLLISGEKFAEEPGGVRFLLRAVWHLALVVDQEEKAKKLLIAIVALVGKEEVIDTLASELSNALIVGAPDNMIDSFRDFVMDQVEK
ncbi:MAG: hypothetical protein GW762_02545 [Candidatus Pacebacteria bacterium]|nr:hypothetical protein [Candidatus Paceibacterota bacterium]PIR64114.1 MAG: hypothetical protein COU64_01035 [Candidatus Pacebacteria bacterium CG10_big_fil_rev_8_21_14_0_10_40_26]PIZ78466.1 MAG: hypothetical protein COY01_04415 [Candidatus Pacebacteria bacterium CG_4_10_14_0_2_um_filter_40_20]PJA69316.1 MAG: hypothetical protein CO156_00300 [Candidatus Pacebacteria bacterium CG_4_9_14_3_um_filter_40_12]PJC41999.1 MAG: hypothetical protein CO041_01855 [Candidatus Pacebacteria bacterium CG_4_9_